MGDMKVMFTAVADHGGKYGPYSTETTLVFNSVVTNVGNGYDGTSGIFTAPVAGVYFFTFSYHADGTGKTGLSLIKGGNLMVKMGDDTQASSRVDNAGNAAVLQLNAGETVFVHLPAQCHVWAAESSTSFTGFLIRQM